MEFSETWKSYAKEWEDKIGAFIQFAPEKAQISKAKEPSGHISNLPFAVKDNIAVQDFSLSCGSKLLENMVSPYTASAVKKLEEAGASVIGKTNMDEFGMGSSTDLSALKKTNNPWDTSRVSGGSSGGSAAAVAAGIVPFALGSDTGGSVRQPAAFCGVVGLKPTWGAVSRFGLVAYASSLETIGILADGVKRCKDVFNIIKGRDPMDQTSRDAPATLISEKSEKVIGVLSPEALAKAIADDFEGGGMKEAAQAMALEDAVRRSFDGAKEKLSALGYRLLPVEIPALKYGVPAYYTIATAEASANLARFDGIRYGKRPDWAENPEELINKARTEGFGPEVKLRILLGTFVLRSGFQDRYYHRAQKIRIAIRENFEKYLGSLNPNGELREGPCAAILLPVFPTRAFGRGGAGLSNFAQKAADLYTCCANLAGLPALSFPASLEEGLPVGVQLMGRNFNEERLFDIASAYEKANPLPHPSGWKQFWAS
ncbi:MAG: aspartyl/glutamyl-tRNA amidotransferase subunit A [Spirochaetaceae bacterium]|jgi:aspartyl-tRNA(Asn)/glutamyl-tRNA(Gln) amidotransferase subunit A|nr:aspartyl/glutamyl-tRNA amidotransferase subunit A [Spirochaetaceae bacterium]